MQELQQLLAQMLEQPDIEIADIPNIDLYMDQVITIFENALGTSKRVPEDKLLTKTMINNYTKDKILKPAVNKKYSSEHILHMALIYHLKQSLSIGDIKTLFQQTLHQEEVNLSEVYQEFLNLKRGQSALLEDHVEAIEQGIASGEEREQEKQLLTVLLLIHHANTYKRLAEKLIDQMKPEA